MIPAQNNFTALRYVLASMVALCHLSELSQVPDFQFFYDSLNAPMAVHGFFVISGFLIYRSYLRNPEWKHYLQKRLRRILPAYISVVLVAAVGLFFVSDVAPKEYFGDSAWWKYLFANLFTLNFLQPELPGVFQQNYMHAVNGSLWTIKIEIGFYLTLPILVFVLNRLQENVRGYVLLALMVVSLVYAEFFMWMFDRTGEAIYVFLHRQLPGKLCFFVSGMLLHRYFEVFLSHKHYIGVLSLLLTTASLMLGVEWLSVFSLAGLVGWLVFCLPPWFTFLDRHDYSYGMYLWHFPLVQIFASQNWFYGNSWAMFIAFFMTLIGISAVSWYCLELRFIRK